ncbi:hypothetical protein KCA24_27725, partial [Escherichia coli]|nr:hypothetical protein [Escherichia coli]
KKKKNWRGCGFLKKKKPGESPVPRLTTNVTKMFFGGGGNAQNLKLPVMSTLRNAQLRKQLKL